MGGAGHSINIFHLKDDQVREIWVEFDDLGEIQQLGVVPMPA